MDVKLFAWNRDIARNRLDQLRELASGKHVKASIALIVTEEQEGWPMLEVLPIDCDLEKQEELLKAALTATQMEMNERGSSQH